jgi:hypothetical protein
LTIGNKSTHYDDSSSEDSSREEKKKKKIKKDKKDKHKKKHSKSKKEKGKKEKKTNINVSTRARRIKRKNTTDPNDLILSSEIHRFLKLS